MKNLTTLIAAMGLTMAAHAQSGPGQSELDRNFQHQPLTTSADQPEALGRPPGNVMQGQPTLVLASCSGCRHTEVEEEELQMLMQRFQASGTTVITADVPASQLPGNTLFPDNTLRPGRERPQRPGTRGGERPTRGSQAPAFHKHNPSNEARLIEAARLGGERHAVLYDERGNEVYSGDLAGLVRHLP